MMEGRVIALHRKVQRGRMVRANRLVLTTSGIEEDYHRGSENRQVLMLEVSTLEEFGYQPGDLREQVLVDFPPLQSLPPGARISVGTADLEVTMDCTPCAHMAEALGEEPGDFVNRILGKRGVLARVVGAGEVAVGDVVREAGS